MKGVVQSFPREQPILLYQEEHSLVAKYIMIHLDGKREPEWLVALIKGDKYCRITGKSIEE